MRRRTLFAVVLVALFAAQGLLAEEPAPVANPPAGSLRLKTLEAEAQELEDGEVTGNVQKPTVDVIMTSTPVAPDLQPPKRPDEGESK